MANRLGIVFMSSLFARSSADLLGFAMAGNAAILANSTTDLHPGADLLEVLEAALLFHRTGLAFGLGAGSRHGLFNTKSDSKGTDDNSEREAGLHGSISSTTINESVTGSAVPRRAPGSIGTLTRTRVTRNFTSLSRAVFKIDRASW